jgi:hypothetical protein
VSKYGKHQEFHLSLGVVVRLLVFTALIYFAINYFSSAKAPSISSSSVLGTEIATSSGVPQLKSVYDEVYSRLPPSSRQTLENLNSSPAIILVQEKIDYLKEESSGFPQKQITDLKRSVIQAVYEEIMKNYGH